MKLDKSFRLAALLLSALLLLALAACGQKSDDDLLETIRQRGELIIATEGNWSPWTFHDENDVLTGFDIEIGQRIADALGVKATFIEGEWDGLLAGMEAGRYDLMINGVGVTADRQEKFDFSETYAYDKVAVITLKDNDSIQAMEDLSGKSTANTISSTYAEIAERYGAKVTGVDDLAQTFELLLANRIDATLNAEVTYYDYMAAHPDANVKIAVLGEVTPIAIPMTKGQDNLRKAVDDVIKSMREDGSLSALSVKYFGMDITNP